MMNRLKFISLICACSFLQIIILASLAHADYAADHILVRFKDDAIAEKTGRTRNIGKEFLLNTLNLPEGCDIQESKFSTLQRKKSITRITVDDPINVDRYVRVTVPDGMTVESLCDLLNARDDVEYAEPNGFATGGLVPNDPDFTNQWFHNNTIYTGGEVPSDIQSTSLWEITTGYSNIILAVTDTGLTQTGIEFTNRIVAGYDFVNDDADPIDDNNHGSLVTGCAAATGNNGSRIAGINWQCRIMPVKVLGSGNSGTYADIADGIEFASSNGAKVICCSIGGSSHSTTLSNAIMSVIENGTIFVTITHNDSSSSIRFPGRMKECITVGATTNTDIWAKFSNYGPSIDLCAPGDQISSLAKNGAVLHHRYGTSFACPLVAGVAAIIAGIRPNIGQEEMEAILCASADDQVGDAKDTPGHDNYHGWGRLNAYNAVVMAMSSNRFSNDGPGNFTMSWDSPPNASNRNPFKVQTATAVTGIWTTVAASNDFTYTASQTTWQVNGLSDTNVFLRVLIRPQ